MSSAASVRGIPAHANLGRLANSTPSDDDGTALEVAAHLTPIRAFDSASALVIEHLARMEPLGMWAVTRIVGGRQILLAVDAPAYGIPRGAEISYAESMCRPMVTGAGPQIAPDITQVAAYAAVAPLMPMPIGAYVGAPLLRSDGSLFGTLCGYSPKRHPPSLTSHQVLLDLLSSMLSAVLDVDTAATATARALEISRVEADTDALTGLLNRRGWDRYLRREEERFRRFGDAACVIVLDLDNLKAVNDTQGHDAGDRYIRQAAHVLAANAREGDILCRLGGDEFGIIAIGANTSLAKQLVLGMEQALQDAGVSGSFGHAPYSVVTGFPGAWEAADKAMYKQKQKQKRRTTKPK